MESGPFSMTQPDFSPAADRNRQPILDLLRQINANVHSALPDGSHLGNLKRIGAV